MDVINRLELTSPEAQALAEEMEKRLVEHGNYIVEHGVDMPEVRNWRWEV